MLWPVLNYGRLRCCSPQQRSDSTKNKCNKSDGSVRSCSTTVILLASWVSRGDTHVKAGASHLSQIIFPQHNKQYPARLVPAHLQFNQFTKPILLQTFQHWKGQGCYIRHIKAERSIISKSIAVSVGVLNCERIDTLPLPYKGCTSDTDDAQRRKKPFLAQIIWNCPLNFSCRPPKQLTDNNFVLADL